MDRSPPPAVVVEIAQPIKAALQLLRSVFLFLGNTMPWHIPAPLEMPRRVVRPSWAFEAAAEALVGVGLDDGNARIRVARGALTFDITAGIVVAKAKREAMLIDANRLSDGSAGSENEGCSPQKRGDTHGMGALVVAVGAVKAPECGDRSVQQLRIAANRDGKSRA